MRGVLTSDSEIGCDKARFLYRLMTNFSNLQHANMTICGLEKIDQAFKCNRLQYGTIICPEPLLSQFGHTVFNYGDQAPNQIS